YFSVNIISYKMNTFLDSSNSFKIEPTRNTPYVSYSSDVSLLEIKGVSSPNNTPVFYAPIITFIENLSAHSISHITVRIALLYFNSSSAKALFKIFESLKASEESIPISIDWVCDEDDEDMIESIQDIEDLLDIDINTIIEKYEA
ncbi:MAG: DUF1987 domain-containing protein, partial [Bacteroidota bacterium]